MSVTGHVAKVRHAAPVGVALAAAAAGAVAGYVEAGIPVLLVSALLVGAAQQSLP